MIQLMTKEQFKDLFEIMDYSFPRNERRDMDEQLALFDDGRYKVACQYGDDGKLHAFMAYWELDGVTYLEHFDDGTTGNKFSVTFTADTSDLPQAPQAPQVPDETPESSSEEADAA